MPELPEVEIAARRISAAAAGATIESTLAPGINTLKTFDPPLHALDGTTLTGIERRGKHLLIRTDAGLTVLLHLMSAGRLQLFPKRASMKDRTSRLLLRLDGDRELRLREFGTKQAAWARVVRDEQLEEEEVLKTLGPEAWPDPPPLGPLLTGNRPLRSLLRDQRVIAGIGRSWADEILWVAKLSPYKRGGDLSDEEATTLRDAIISELGRALDDYEANVHLPIPDKTPMPLRIHRRNGEPCPRCGTTIEAVFSEDDIACYCPTCQTGGRILKDRRLSKLLK